MNKKSIFLPSIVAAYAGSVLLTIPGLKTLGCCLIVPGAVVGAMYFYKKLNPLLPSFSVKESVKFSLMTGLFIALFSTALDLVITLIFKSNDFTQSLPEMEKMMAEMAPGPALKDAIQLLRAMASQIELTGFSFLYAILSLTGNLLMDLLFALPGGLFARNFFNKKSLNL